MGSSHAVLHGMYKLLAREGVASKWLTHDLRCVSLGLLLHGRLPQLLCQLPHPVLHPLQEDLPQHHAGLGKDVHFLAPPTSPPTAHFQVTVSQFASVSYHCCAAVTKGPKTSVFTRPSVCLVLSYMCCVGRDGLVPISLLTPNPKPDSSSMDLRESTRGRWRTGIMQRERQEMMDL